MGFACTDYFSLCNLASFVCIFQLLHREYEKGGEERGGKRRRGTILLNPASKVLLIYKYKKYIPYTLDWGYSPPSVTYIVGGFHFHSLSPPLSETRCIIQNNVIIRCMYEVYVRFINTWSPLLPLLYPTTTRCTYS